MVGFEVLLWVSGPEKFPGLSRSGAPGYCFVLGGGGGSFSLPSVHYGER